MLLGIQSPENLEIKELTNRYIDLEQDRDKRFELIESIADLGTQNALYLSGALFQEIAVDPETNSSDRRNSFNETKNLWELAVQEWYEEQVDPAILYSAIGLVVMNNTVRVSSKVTLTPDTSTGLDSYTRMLEVAKKALELRSRFNEQGNKENAVCTVNILNHLMTLLLIQRKSIIDLGFEYLGLPSQISQNRRLIDSSLSATSWDTSLYKIIEGKRPELVNKIQSRTSIKAEIIPGDILVINNGKILALTKGEYKKEIKSFNVVESIVEESLNSNSSGIGSDRTLNSRTLNLLKVIL